MEMLGGKMVCPRARRPSGKLRQHDSAAIHVEGESCQRWAGRRRFAGVERCGKKIGAGRAVALIRRSCSSFESLSGSGWAGWQAGRVPGRVTAALPRNAQTRSLLSPHGQQTRAWQPGTRAEGGIRGPGGRQSELTGRFFRSAGQAPGESDEDGFSHEDEPAGALGDEMSSACAQRRFGWRLGWQQGEKLAASASPRRRGSRSTGWRGPGNP